MLNWLKSFFKTTPKRIDHRNQRQKVALVLVHGFTGDTRATWANFVDLLLAEPRIKSWDLFGIGYPSSLRVDVPNVWAADPDIGKLALGLSTRLDQSPFIDYQRIAIAAHSMGGLVVQRALLDNPSLQARISHVFFFGTPSGGLSKARPFLQLKRQIRDMDAAGEFITALRRDWNARFLSPPEFFFRTVAGDRDEFVPAASSIEPFADQFRAVVPGNHLEIVKPEDVTHASVPLVIDALDGRSAGRRTDVDGARIAVELGNFQQVIDTLLPKAATIDSDALAGLALALETVGRKAEALSILEQYFKGGRSSTDAQGILAGRLKRRWLVGREQNDLERAKALYSDALDRSEQAGDHSQAYYHAINVAFLDLISSPPNSDVPRAVIDMAERARNHCRQAKETQWRFATEAEAFLMLGDLDGAENLYRRAKALTESPRELDSMYGQAVRVATRMFGKKGADRIEQIFGAKPSS
jgi:pimeloyl-ACP methyl ester carboxylesterase